MRTFDRRISFALVACATGHRPFAPEHCYKRVTMSEAGTSLPADLPWKSPQEGPKTMARIVTAVLYALRENWSAEDGRHFHAGGIDRPYPCFDPSCSRYRHS